MARKPAEEPGSPRDDASEHEEPSDDAKGSTGTAGAAGANAGDTDTDAPPLAPPAEAPAAPEALTASETPDAPSAPVALETTGDAHRRWTRGRAVLGAVALLLVATGVGVLLYARAPVERAPAPVPTASLAASAVPAPSGAQEEPVLSAAEPTRLRIPSLDVRAKVRALGLNDDGTVAVPTLEQVDDVGWYKFGPTPGEKGPAVLLGHVDSTTGPAVFYDVGGMRRGDRIMVDRADGKTAVFAVESGETVPKDDFPTERVYGELGYPGLRLITCGGDFDEGERSYEDNVVVFARLVDVRT